MMRSKAPFRRSRLRFYRPGALICALAAAGYANAAEAVQQAGAEQPGGLEDIVVTARRTAERLQDVPIAVTALSSESLRTNNVLRTEDLQAITPGLTIAPSQRSDSAPNYTIRGQRGELNPGPLTDSAIGIYFAEMNQARSQGTNQALFDLESIQVLKGAQGTLFGRNNTGGAVLITPKAPSRDFEGYGQISVGNFDFFDGEFVANVPLGDRIQIRAGGKISKRAGYMINVAQPGVKANDLDAQAYRLQVAIQPTDAINSTFIATRFKSDEVGTAQKLTAIDPLGVPASITGANRTFLLNFLQSQLVANQALGKYEYINVDPVGNRERVWSVQNNSTIELGELGGLGDIVFKNVIGTRRAHGSFHDNRNSQLTTIPGTTRSKLFTEEAQIQTDGKYLDLVLGAYYYRETGNDFFPLINNQILSQISPATFPTANVPDIDYKSRSWAIFGHFNYEMAGVMEGLMLAGGVRYTKDRKSVVYHTITYRGVNPTAFTCATTNTPIPRNDRDLCVFPDRDSWSEVSYDASLSYKITSDIMAYITHRHGYRAGGFGQFNIVNSPIRSNYDPETVDDLEAGFKSDLDLGGIPARLNVAGYLTWYKDIQRGINLLNPAGGSSSTVRKTVNAAGARVNGFEIEFTVRPAPDLTLSANYAYTDAYYTEFVDTYVSGGVPKQVDISDSPFGYVPKHQYGATLNYRLPIDEAAGEVMFNLNLSGISKRASRDDVTANCGPDGNYVACRNSLEPKAVSLRGFELVNLRLDWRSINGGPIDVAFFMNNVFDKFYRTHNANNLGSSGLHASGIGKPRMFGVQIRANIGQ